MFCEVCGDERKAGDLDSDLRCPPCAEREGPEDEFFIEVDVTLTRVYVVKATSAQEAMEIYKSGDGDIENYSEDEELMSLEEKEDTARLVVPTGTPYGGFMPAPTI